jgi:hypothetical protein
MSAVGGPSTVGPRSSRPIRTGGDHILFYEYFHGDNGAGLGASHQTGWTGMVAKLIEFFGLLDAGKFLEGGVSAGFVRGKSEGGATT